MLLRRVAPLIVAAPLIASGAACTTRDVPPSRAVNAVATRQSGTTAPPVPIADCSGRTVTGDSVGHVRIGMALDVLRRMCAVVHDTTLQPVANVPRQRRVSFLIGTDTATAVVNAGRIWELTLAGPAFRTADSLGIGTPLRTLLAAHGAKGYGIEELFVQTPVHCGLTFHIAGRYAGMPRERDSATMAAAAADSLVDRLRIDGCDPEDREAGRDVPDDSTYDVQTDSIALAHDLDGNGVADYVVLETRPVHRDVRHLSWRIAVYLDSIPSNRRARWATGWTDEAEYRLGDVVALGARGSLVEVLGNDADYTSETLLSVRDGAVVEEITNGEDYGNGFLDITKEGGSVVVEASQVHFLVRGKPVGAALECRSTEWAAVRARWDDAARRFVPDRPRCVKPKQPDGNI